MTGWCSWSGCLTLAFVLGFDLRVMGLGPKMCPVLHEESAWDSLFLSLLCPSPSVHTFSKKAKQNKQTKEENAESVRSSNWL